MNARNTQKKPHRGWKWTWEMANENEQTRKVYIFKLKSSQINEMCILNPLETDATLGSEKYSFQIIKMTQIWFSWKECQENHPRSTLLVLFPNRSYL